MALPTSLHFLSLVHPLPAVTDPFHSPAPGPLHVLSMLLPLLSAQGVLLKSPPRPSGVNPSGHHAFTSTPRREAQTPSARKGPPISHVCGRSLEPLTGFVNTTSLSGLGTFSCTQRGLSQWPGFEHTQYNLS